MVDVDGVLGVGQILDAQSREVVVAIGDPLHHASALWAESALEGARPARIRSS